MIKSAFAEVDETKSCTIVYEKGCCDELFGQRSFVMLIIFFCDARSNLHLEA